MPTISARLTNENSAARAAGTHAALAVVLNRAGTPFLQPGQTGLRLCALKPASIILAIGGTRAHPWFLPPLADGCRWNRALVESIQIWHPPIGCDPTLTIVGGPALFSSHALQIFSLIIYFLLLTPGANLLPPILFFVALHITYNRFRSWWDRRGAMPIDAESQKAHTTFLVVGLVLLVVINIIFLVDIELTLSRNKHLQSAGTYGTALQAASANGHVAVVELLLANRTDKKKKQYINIVGGCYGSALCAACANDEVEVGELLIAGGAKAKLDGELFGTPLHVASLMGNTKIITLLLGKLGGRNPNTQWGDFGTALDVAKMLNNNKAADLLKEGGLKEVAKLPGFFMLMQQPLFHPHATGMGKSPYVSSARALLTTAFPPSRNRIFRQVALCLHCTCAADNGFFTLAQQWLFHIHAIDSGKSPCVFTACMLLTMAFPPSPTGGGKSPCVSTARVLLMMAFFMLAQQPTTVSPTCILHCLCTADNGFFTLAQQRTGGKSPCISTAHTADDGFSTLVQQEVVNCTANTMCPHV
ncbi:hypothetical protein B0H17DRAFT_1130195 [Mycena rosella]|uniref:Uncharacterized protein n=1 Tax=Mycena rosella TaxID=1033263 RepID=A0AAD7DRW8_MYCRO|nr:hypothetical protein B0H17DRAFT_1130195 [Mycena rosella]